MGFLGTILIILLVYYLFKILARWFAPKLFSYAVKRTEKHFQERFGQFRSPPDEDDTQIGDVTVDRKPSNETNTSKNVGEYIDFEEIE